MICSSSSSWNAACLFVCTIAAVIGFVSFKASCCSSVIILFNFSCYFLAIKHISISFYSFWFSFLVWFNKLSACSMCEENGDERAENKRNLGNIITEGGGTDENATARINSVNVTLIEH
jgi:hypothetical protein